MLGIVHSSEAGDVVLRSQHKDKCAVGIVHSEGGDVVIILDDVILIDKLAILFYA